MALSPGEERDFRALVADLEPTRVSRGRTLAWVAVVIACLCAVCSAPALDSRWLAFLGWLGLISAGLAAVAAPIPACDLGGDPARSSGGGRASK